MAQKVLFISESQVKAQSFIDNNVDGKLLSKTIELVQDISLKGILGKALYDTLINEVYEFKTNDVEIPELHSELLNDYIKPYLVHQTVVDYITVSSFRMTNKGLMKATDDAFQTLSGEELTNVRALFANYATQYKQNLIEFLKDNNLIADRESVDTDIISAGGGGWYLKSRLN